MLPKLFPLEANLTIAEINTSSYRLLALLLLYMLLSLPAVWSATLITRQARNAIPSLFWIDNLNCATVLRVLHTVAVGIILESLVVDLYALFS